MTERIELSGLNGIRININVGFHKVIEDVIERVAASPELNDIDSETIAELVTNAVSRFDLELQLIKGYVEASRNTAHK